MTQTSIEVPKRIKKNINERERVGVEHIRQRRVQISQNGGFPSQKQVTFQNRMIWEKLCKATPQVKQGVLLCKCLHPVRELGRKKQRKGKREDQLKWAGDVY